MNSFTFRNVSEALPVLCGELLKNGDEVGSRNGRTMELPFTHITLTHPWERYITVPGRKASLPAAVAETMWILAGRNDIEWLSHYLPRAAEFSDDGKTWRGGYGPRLRDFGGENGNGIDQLKHVVELLKKEPLTRRAVMSIYDPVFDTDPGKDIPCNDFIQFMSRLGKLDMHVFIRSNDLMWGWSGINTFEWSALQEIVAGLLGIQIGQLHFSISSLHLYDRHWKKAEELSRAEPMPVSGVKEPLFDTVFNDITHLDALVTSWFEVEEVIRTQGPDAAERQIAAFPEPMLRAWLKVIARYHGGRADIWGLPSWDMDYASVSSPKKDPGKTTEWNEQLQTTLTPFVAYVDNLHREKTKAYGDSWKRRGEMLGIMANIARKIDRLGHDGGGDTATDTAVDVLVYLIKYRIWLIEQDHGAAGTDEVDLVTDALILQSEMTRFPYTPAVMEEMLTDMFETLEHQVEEKRVTRLAVVESMIRTAYQLASHLWWKDQNATRAFTGYPS